MAKMGDEGEIDWRNAGVGARVKDCFGLYINFTGIYIFAFSMFFPNFQKDWSKFGGLSNGQIS